jgi:hypothetical protein
MNAMKAWQHCPWTSALSSPNWCSIALKLQAQHCRTTRIVWEAVHRNIKMGCRLYLPLPRVELVRVHPLWETTQASAVLPT